MQLQIKNQHSSLLESSCPNQPQFRAIETKVKLFLLAGVDNNGRTRMSVVELKAARGFEKEPQTCR